MSEGSHALLPYRRHQRAMPLLPARAVRAEQFLDGRVILHCGDCREVLPTLAENSIDACVTDPPYHLTSIVKRFGKSNSANESYVNAAPKPGYMAGYMSRGFMGKAWDGGDIAFQPETWAAMLRMLKPGGHLLACGGTRTYHRLVCAIEDAGFEIRDCIVWAYGSGFPKSHDVSKGIDRAAGETGGYGERKANIHSRGNHILHEGWKRPWMDDPSAVERSGREYIPATDAARQWSGWGSALKPAIEPICLARKPLGEGTIAANVIKWGCGALNIDGCRVGTDVITTQAKTKEQSLTGLAQPDSTGSHKWQGCPESQHVGRWPANIIHDGSPEVVEAFPETTSGSRNGEYGNGTFSSGKVSKELVGDSGSAARFFYTSKADSDDRLGSKHPTVKPLDLMQYLVRLVTPKGGTVLDPFAGTGTTGEAAFREGMRAVLIERENEYVEDIRRRMALVLAGPDERMRESVKARGTVASPGPLFETISPHQ
jgi:DNA modification methylase